MSGERSNVAVSGYRFEATLAAFVCLHILAKESLGWLEEDACDCSEVGRRG